MITWIKANPIATLFILAALVAIGVWVYNKFFKGTNGSKTVHEEERPVDYTQRVQQEETPNTIASTSNMMKSMQNMANSANAMTSTNGGGMGSSARTSGGKANG